MKTARDGEWKNTSNRQLVAIDSQTVNNIFYYKYNISNTSMMKDQNHNEEINEIDSREKPRALYARNLLSEMNSRRWRYLKLDEMASCCGVRCNLIISFWFFQ